MAIRIMFNAFPQAIAIKPSLAPLLARAEAETAVWRELNPYWSQFAYVEIARGVARCRYSSDQGTSTFAIVR